MNLDAVPPHPVKVLVVDDEHSIADTLTAILRKQGFDTAAAYCGTTAVQAAQLWRPDVLLTDIVMPGMNGIEAAICIRAAHPRCRILLFSGHSLSDENALTCLSFGERNVRFLQKPLHPDALLTALRELTLPDPCAPSVDCAS